MFLPVLLVFVLAPVLPVVEEAKAASPPLAVESIVVEPASPGPDSLCKLSVSIQSSGSRKASAFAFRVWINGKELPVYRNEIFFSTVDPRASGNVRLHSFWSTETGWPAPKDGKLSVQVSLTEGRWMDAQTKDGEEVWAFAGAVDGLPVTKTLTLSMRPR